MHILSLDVFLGWLSCTPDAFYSGIRVCDQISWKSNPGHRVTRDTCDCLPSTWLYTTAQNLATPMCPTKTRDLPFPMLSMALPPFVGFHDYTYQSLEGANLPAKGKTLSKVKSAQGRCICWVHTYNLGDGGRPLIVISRLISIIPSISADNQCNVCMT